MDTITTEYAMAKHRWSPWEIAGRTQDGTLVQIRRRCQVRHRSADTDAPGCTAEEVESLDIPIDNRLGSPVVDLGFRLHQQHTPFGYCQMRAVIDQYRAQTAAK